MPTASRAERPGATWGEAVPDTRTHRGPGPRDRELFGGPARPALATAAAEFSWLLSRGYAGPSALKLVGDRHRLVERQRLAVLRCAGPDAAVAGRRERLLGVDALRGRPIRIDGFNLVLTLESALGGGVVLGGRDGCFRDLAGVHGSYRKVAETRPALELAARRLDAWGVGPRAWLLDAPVSNSGLLAALIRAVDLRATAEVVPDPDPLLLLPGPPVATADSGVLDRCGPWLNLARLLVEAEVPDAFVVDLS
ncbi:DUF434 domain-containing protein [Paludisphaera soli]|uniref:DUF434 domain-containing protein n=1 Tax=Paludisphaera soli TaxID=2712865 RepID=UPI0013EC284C|nr:DUF434 domain-containing protein [Paludisphaera soli]